MGLYEIKTVLFNLTVFAILIFFTDVARYIFGARKENPPQLSRDFRHPHNGRKIGGCGRLFSASASF